MDKVAMAIVGHKDHGKSTLIGRLLLDTESLTEDRRHSLEKICEELGTELKPSMVTDYLREEREDDKTIDTSTLFFQENDRRYEIIDTPGHKEFLKNMISGSSHADTGIILLDANEGVQEQTTRHLYVLHLFGISDITVAINKMDMLDYNQEKYEELKEEIEDLAREVGMEIKHVIPISALEGDNVIERSENMDWYEGKTILESLEDVERTEDFSSLPLRMPVQYVYDGRVLGTVVSGTLQEGQEVDILPAGEKAKVEEIERFNDDKDGARAGEAVGCVLNGSEDVERGNVLCTGSAEIRDSVRGILFWMSPDPLREGEELVCENTTQAVTATVSDLRTRIDSSSWESEKEPEEVGQNDGVELELDFDSPFVLDSSGDGTPMERLVLKRGDEIVAYGQVMAAG